MKILGLKSIICIPNEQSEVLTQTLVSSIYVLYLAFKRVANYRRSSNLLYSTTNELLGMMMSPNMQFMFLSC